MKNDQDSQRILIEAYLKAIKAELLICIKDLELIAKRLQRL
jgi:hypothetical protein